MAEIGTLKNRLNAFPVEITVPDPVSGQDFTFNRKDVLAALVVDRGNLSGDAAIVAGQYGEMARLERASASASSSASTQFVQWKASKVNEYHKSKLANNEKGTDKGAEAAYRTHKDYESISNLASYYANLRDLFADLKKAFDIKSEMIKSLTYARNEHSDVERNASKTNPVVEDDGSSLEELEEEAARSIAETRKQQSKPSLGAPPKLPKPPAIEDDEDEEEEEAPVTKPKAKVKPKAKPVVEDEDDEDEEEVEEDEEDEEEEPVVEPKKRGRPKGSKNTVKAKPVVEEDEDEEEEVEEDDEEEATPPKKKAKPVVEDEDDEDEDEEEVEEDEEEEEAPPPRRPRKGNK